MFAADCQPRAAHVKRLVSRTLRLTLPWRLFTEIQLDERIPMTAPTAGTHGLSLRLVSRSPSALSGAHRSRRASRCLPERDRRDGRSSSCATKPSKVLRRLSASSPILTTEIGPRPAGSENDRKAVAWAARRGCAPIGLEVRTEEVTVPHWVRGEAAGTASWRPFPTTCRARGPRRQRRHAGRRHRSRGDRGREASKRLAELDPLRRWKARSSSSTGAWMRHPHGRRLSNSGGRRTLPRARQLRRRSVPWRC